MIYTEMCKKALRIAFDAHIGQVDRTGLPYVFHPFHLAEQMHDEVSVCAAFLHDVVEDTDVTFEDLAAQGMSEEVIDAMRLLTHDDDVLYMDYIRAIKKAETLRRSPSSWPI
jgi:(p)ppGpp synthase/HD superfamily hydrolase